MRKHFNVIFIGIVCLPLFFWGCRKYQIVSTVTANQSLIESAKIYFDQFAKTHSSNIAQGSPRILSRKLPDWSSATVMNLSNGKAVVVPIKFDHDLYVKNNFGNKKLQSLSDLTRLIIYKDSSGTFHSELMTSLPDTVVNPAYHPNFSGIIRVEDWNGNLLKEFKYNKDGSRLKLDPSKAKQVLNAPTESRLAASAKISPESIIYVDYYLDGYNYGLDDPSGGEYWSEYIGTIMYFIPDDGGGAGGGGGGDPGGGDYGSIGGGGGSGGTTPANTFSITSPTNIIANVTDYMKCFSNYGGSDHTYQVQVCVSQPNPGTRDAWVVTNGGIGGSVKAGNPLNVGHTFLVFSEIFGDHSIVRNVGFYPQNMAAPWPFATSDQGQLNNDAGHDYNISVTVNLTNGQFFNMLNFVEQGNNPGYLYDLNNNNCTSFALQALSAGGVVFPATVGTWTDGGHGNDPGDLGEDLRSMTLPSNMARSTSESAHPNVGSCN